MSSDLTFLTNESGKTLRDPFSDILKENARFFDCLIGYFFISGFYKLYPALENVEKARILIGLQTDRSAYELLQEAREQGQLPLQSHAAVIEKIPDRVLKEFENSADSAVIETGVHKFVEWVRSGKLEIKAYPGEKLHAKVYIMTFNRGFMDKGRVITGSSNLTQSGLQDNLEFNVELKNRADYDFAIAKFNELWAVAVDVSQPYEDTIVNRPPFAHSLLTYFRQGRLDKFFIAPPGATESRELDFFATAKTIKPTDSVEKRGERVVTGVWA